MDSSVLYSSESDNVELKIEAADYFLKNSTNITTFSVVTVHNAAWSALTDVGKVHL